MRNSPPPEVGSALEQRIRAIEVDGDEGPSETVATPGKGSIEASSDLLVAIVTLAGRPLHRSPRVDQHGSPIFRFRGESTSFRCRAWERDPRGRPEGRPSSLARLPSCGERQGRARQTRYYSKPTLGDLGGDGDLDVVSGNAGGTFSTYFVPEPLRGLMLGAGIVLLRGLGRPRRGRRGARRSGEPD